MNAYFVISLIIFSIYLVWKIIRVIIDAKVMWPIRNFFKYELNIGDFELQTTRVRIHRQLPGQEIPLHTDGNNTTVKNKDDYMIRSITALTGSKDFRYNFIDTENKRRVQWLRQGETILFDPDLVAHGMANESTTETRYALVQIFKLYPVTDWARDFISTEKVVTI